MFIPTVFGMSFPRKTQQHVRKLCLVLMLAGFLAPILPADSIVDGVYVQEAEAKKREKAKKKKTLPELVSEQKQTDKWAAIVVDANRGSILFEKNAELKRFPASLTKMMTLYLLFDSLDRKKTRLSTSMRASKRAAAQPQTNVSLKKGNTITVKQAIEALIIRSANDVAVVVAEHIGGSESGFIRKMNKKAKELGMSRTNFVNPHGLPNSRQISTAADMAKLSIALRRDFPHYYKYFKKTSFRFKGKTYTSHNRVLGRLPGVDGIKTGYIRASGFNLATSLTRGNTRIVAVVMGGKTGASRDQEMVNMLDRTLLALKAREAEERRLAAIKAKEEKRRQQAAKLAAEAREREQAAWRAAEAKRAAQAAQTAQIDSGVPQALVDQRANDQARFEQILRAPVTPRRALTQTAPYLSGKNWAVQVGAFPTIEQAERAAAQAREIAPGFLSTATLDISQIQKGERVFNRSRMLFLSADQARNVCDRLSSARKQCIVIRMEN